MQKLIWQNAEGEEINLTSGNYGITEWEGFSNADLNIQSQQVPFQDGGVFLDALLEQRELSVTLAMNDEGNLETRYRLRRELIHALNPKLGEGYLIYTNDFISKRIKCVAQVPLFETHNSNDSGTPKASLAWTACNPYWEDVDETSTVIDGEVEIENSGDIPTQVVVKLYNTDNVLVQNLTNGKILKMLNLGSLKNVEINTNNGKKEVEESLITYESVYGTSKGICEDNNGRIIQGVGHAFRITERLIDNKEIQTLYNIGKIVFFNNYIYFNNYNTGKFYRTQDFENFELVITVNTNYPNYFGIVNNKLFISGYNKIYYSEDGTTWNEENISFYIYGMTYWNGTYYVTDTDNIYSSVDLQNWTIKYSVSGTDKLYNIAHNDSNIVCVGDGIILSSTGGSVWNELTTDKNLADITVKENVFYIAGQNGALLKTIDGIKITDLTQSTYAATNFLQIINSSDWGLIIRAESGFVMTFDGNILNEYNNIGDCPTSNIYKILKYKSGLIAMGGFYSNAYFHIFLNNQWESLVFENETIHDIFVTQDNNILLSITEGVYLSSDDGEHFTKVSNVIMTIQRGKDDCLYGIGFDNSILKDRAYVSIDEGQNWSELGILQDRYKSIVFSNYYNKYFAITYQIMDNVATFIIYNSVDGLNYTAITESQIIDLGSNFTPYLRCFGSEIIVMGQSEVFQSSNGTSFVKQNIQWNSGIKEIQKQGTVYIGIDSNSVLKFSKFSEIFSLTKILEPLSILIDNLDIYIGCVSGYIGKIAETNKTQNLIAKLSNDSDMTFNLEIGNNLIKTITKGEIRFRQKYLGV